MNALVFGFVAVVFAGCALKPTRATESISLPSPAITNETVIIDVRRPYDFASSRLPRSVSMQWSDFTQTDEGRRGLLRQDLFEAARRLARAGVDPEASVVVVGYGADGEGEEGRVAWMLHYLGVLGARFSSINAFPGPFTSRNPFPSNPAVDGGVGEPPARNAPMWKPAPDLSWIATSEEVREATGKKRAVREVALIDVRVQSAAPKIGTIHIPWTEFIDSKGQPACTPVAHLNKLGLNKETRVIVFDELGVASGGVALALRACGFPNTANFAGGLRELSRAH